MPREFHEIRSDGAEVSVNLRLHTPDGVLAGGPLGRLRVVRASLERGADGSILLDVEFLGADAPPPDAFAGRLHS